MAPDTRRLAAEELGVKTSPYRFADTEAEYRAAIEALGLPVVVKPVMSSSGKGQSVVRTHEEAAAAWRYAQEGGRAGEGRVIVEGFIDFEYEITLLTVRHGGETTFCAPIGHSQQGALLIFLEDASAIAEKVQQSKLAALGRLSASIAHEIRNPVGAMSHAGQLLAESPTIGPDERKLTDLAPGEKDNQKLFAKWNLPEKNAYADPAPRTGDRVAWSRSGQGLRYPRRAEPGRSSSDSPYGVSGPGLPDGCQPDSPHRLTQRVRRLPARRGRAHGPVTSLQPMRDREGNR